MWNWEETPSPKGTGGLTAEDEEERGGDGQHTAGKAALCIPKWVPTNHGGTWGGESVCVFEC